MAVTRRVRSVNIKPIETIVRHGADGVDYLKSPQPLGDYPVRITDCLDQWAAAAPARTFLAQRDATGGWRTIDYATALDQVRRLAQALLDRQLSVQRPVLIVSGNGIDHALLALAAMYVGVPYAPIAPAYSLQARDYGTLKQIFDRLTPGLVFAAEGAAFERALSQVMPPGVELVVSASRPAALPATALDELLAVTATDAVDTARDRVGPDTIAKVLFTSGSTGHPKGVINTQRMLCSNEAMIRSVMAFLGDEPRCSAAGCRGITPPAATTTSASSSTMAGRSTSTRASRRPGSSTSR